VTSERSFHSTTRHGAGSLSALADQDGHFLATLLDSVPARVVVVSATDHRYLFANREFLDFADLAPEQVIGHQVADVIGESTYLAYLPALNRLMAGERLTWEGWVEYPKRGHRYVRERLVPCMSVGGACEAIIAFGDDLTDLKFQEREIEERSNELRKSEALKAAIFDNALAAFVSCDSEGRIVEFNPAAEAMFGWKREAVLGRQVGEVIIPARTRLEHQEGMKTLPLGRRFTLSALRADGSEFPAEMLVWRTELDGKAFHSASLADLTGLRNEQLLRALKVERDAAVTARDEANRANASKSTFLAAASHDLRQPLHAIMLLAGVLNRDLEDSEHGAIAHKLSSAVNILCHSVDTLLDVSRLDAQAITPRPRKISVDKVLIELHDIHSPTIESKGLRLSVRGCDVGIHSDQPLLLRLLNNLVDNALKFTKHGGVLLSARHRASGELWIEVWDSGCGIPAKDQERIFDEFTQLNNPNRDRSLGLGLGLSIVTRIADALGMRVRVDSRVGVGTRMRLVVPSTLVTRGPAESAQDFEAEVVSTLGPLPGRVLVVDDDTTVREALAIALRRHNIHCETAGTFDEAIRLWKRPRSFDVLITDLRFDTIVTGVDLAVALRTLHDTEIPCILITGDSSLTQSGAMNALGIRVLVKPVSDYKVLQTLASEAGAAASR